MNVFGSKALTLLVFSLLPFNIMVKPLVLTGEEQRYKLGGILEYLIDHQNQYSINDIRQSNHDLFKTITANTFSLAKTNVPVWLKLTIKNKTKESLSLLLHIDYSNINKIEFYPNEQSS